MKPHDLFRDDTALARARQMRMRRLQVYNWGTFSGLHDIPIAEEGFLFVGRSGSGKSTLLDAIATLLVPPQWLSFNTAAREGDGRRHDRNLASYVRGAWADRKDETTGEITTHHLRNGTTWSAVALEYRNNEGRVVTLVQLFWLRGRSSRNADVVKHFIIAERPFSIATELAGFDLDRRALKHRLSDVYHFDKFRPYGERLRRLLSIDSELALRLLHKTQSAKNLGDLNAFLREFMLEPPRSFEVARRLVEEFAELDGAHQAVVTARRQVETLAPARDAHRRHAELARELNSLRAQAEALETYRDQRRRTLLDAASAELATQDATLAGRESEAQARCERLQEELDTLRDRHRAQGGARIAQLEAELAQARERHALCEARRAQLAPACRALETELPDSAEACAALAARARETLERRRDTERRSEARRDALRDEKRQLEQEFLAIRREIEALQRQPSNIDAAMLELRARIAADLGIDETDLPFAGELLQVRADQAAWRGAIERVLHGFGLSLLVSERHYPTLSRYVNEHSLGRRLVYYRVGEDQDRRPRPLHPQALPAKLEIKPGPFADWLRGELVRRFDYACVDDLHAFRAAERALTVQGQVKHNRWRHEKDDRHRIDDRRRWVLGFDNREKLALYQAQARQLGTRLGALQSALRTLAAERERHGELVLHCQSLANLAWREIDLASASAHIDALQRQLNELRAGNAALRELGERIAARRQELRAATDALNELRARRQALALRRNEYQTERAELDARLAGRTLSTPLRNALDRRFAALERHVTLASLDNLRNRVERALHAEQQARTREQGEQERIMERCFRDFRREWPMEAGDMDDTAASAPDYLALLERIERDGLPQHEQRFFDLLQEQSSENLAALNTHINQARKEIHERMELVNAGLAEAEFNIGTHLQIEVADRHLEDVRRFREQVREVLQHAWTADRERAEERFAVLRDLVHRLSGQDPEQLRWRNRVLDVRQHVEFIGREIDAEGREVEVYRSGAGKSGGQREKLTTTCLAAALHYQLGGSEGEPPVYAPVVLDEAFGKADSEFTELVMNIFRRFGFQMIVATPLKSVMTLEPFIGGACFVDISERRHSATLPIDYDHVRRRLALPDHATAAG